MIFPDETLLLLLLFSEYCTARQTMTDHSTQMKFACFYINLHKKNVEMMIMSATRPSTSGTSTPATVVAMFCSSSLLIRVLVFITASRSEPVVISKAGVVISGVLSVLDSGVEASVVVDSGDRDSGDYC